MKPIPSAVIFAVVFAALALPQPVLANKLRLQGAFTVAFAATLNSPPVAYCGEPARAYKVEAHGDGYSSLGAMAFFLQKTFGENIGHGCLTLSTPDGDSLFATYDLTQGDPNANGFVTDGSGTLDFTGGTGLFKDAKERRPLPQYSARASRFMSSTARCPPPTITSQRSRRQKPSPSSEARPPPPRSRAPD